MGAFTNAFHHKALSQPGISLALTALSLLLLVLVLLSVPGPIKGLYWFSIANTESGDGNLSAGVLGWCNTDTSDCTYAPLSDNKYLSGFINTGEALTVRIMLPLEISVMGIPFQFLDLLSGACYWTIITLIFWVALTASTPMGYKILNLDSITRHLRFAVLESTVLCVSLFGNVLTWMAFGLGRDAYLSVQNGGGSPKSGHAMETSAVAGMIGLISLFTAVWGLHLRLGQAQARWKDEAVMVRRRSMALMAHASQTGDTQGLEGRLSQLGMNEKFGGRWSQGSQGNGMVPAPGYSNGLGVNDGQPGRRASTAKFGYAGDDMLEENLNIAKRNSRDHQDMSLRRSSMISPGDTPYAVAQNSQ